MPAILDKDLVTNVPKALQSKADKPMFFVLVMKGGSSGKLIISKTKIETKKIDAAKKETGGSAVLKGVCYGDKGALVFEMPKVSPNAGPVTKKAIQDQANLAMKVEYRLGRDGDSVKESPDDDEPAKPADTTAKKPDQPAKPADTTAKPADKTAKKPESPNKGGDAASLEAQWKAKLADWTPAIKTALAAKGPNAGPIGKLLAQANALSKPGGDMSQAIDKLTECHKLAGAEAAGTAAANPVQAVAARWNAGRAVAVGKLQEEIKFVVSTKDPEMAKAELELKAVMKQISGKIETRQQANEMTAYLKKDDVVADICQYAFDLRGPLLELLGELTPLLPA